MRYLLDTCVISEAIARQPEPRVIDWLDAQDDAALYLSVITIGEIRRGIEKLTHGQRRAALDTWLNRDLMGHFAGRIHPVETDIVLRWGALTAALEAIGHQMSVLDSLLAATALVHDLALVTRNEKDFAKSGVALVNPWLFGLP